MVKPIPVFAFVFAAFAATSAGGAMDICAPAEDEPPEGRDARDLFLTTWRTLSRHGASLRVRVGVVVEESAELRLATRGHDAEELWLDEITETGRGFTGIPVAASERLAHIRPGQTIGFELRHILGWTLDVEGAPTRAERPRTNLELT
jgi:uncharacterized protein YegJ (DUF2314 family)